MSPKRTLLLSTSLLLLVLVTALKAAPAQWSNCFEPSTRMAAFLPMIEISAAQNDSGKYVTVYDCAERSDAH